jgi:hypothetical protein
MLTRESLSHRQRAYLAREAVERAVPSPRHDRRHRRAEQRDSTAARLRRRPAGFDRRHARPLGRREADRCEWLEARSWCSPGRAPQHRRAAAARGGKNGVVHVRSRPYFAFLVRYRRRGRQSGPLFCSLPLPIGPAAPILVPPFRAGSSPAWLRIPRGAQPCQGPKARPRSEAEGLTRQARRGESRKPGIGEATRRRRLARRMDGAP